MKKSIFLPVKGMAIVMTVILAGFISTGSLRGQTGAQITAFNFTLNPHYPETINHTASTIVVPVYNSADITSLVATFTLSPGAVARVASVQQTSGVGAKDYTTGVVWQITSGDGLTVKNYTVTVTKNAALTDKQLLTFSFAGIPGAVGTINQTDYTVSVVVPYSQPLTDLVATFTSSPLSTVKIGVAIQESGVTDNDFTSTVIYSVVAENTSVRNYYVTVTNAAASAEKQITAFSFRALDPDVIGSINQTSHTITLTVPFGTSVTALVATFTASPLATVRVGSAPQTSGTTANNFSSPVTYTVEAENGDTQNYVVTVNQGEASSAKDMLSFSFEALDPDVIGVIVDQTITLTVPYGTPLTNLIATFTSSPLSTVSIGSTPQISGSSANNFTTDKVYTVTAQNSTTKNYTVHVDVVPALTGKSILTFGFLDLDPEAIGTINETAKTITLTVPYTTDVTSLVPTFTSSPGSTVLVGSTPQTSGVTAQNFSSPVNYTCQSQEGSSEVYTVTVNKVPAATGNSILTFNFEIGFDPDIIGVVNQDTKVVSLTVPFSTDLTLPIIATFTSSEYSTVFLNDVEQVSGVTSNVYTTSVHKSFKCVAQDGSFELYTVRVFRAPMATGTSILTFKFETGFNPAIVGTINQTNMTIALTVPYSTNVTALVATFTSSPYSTVSVNDVDQVSGVTANNFTSPVIYRCTAENGSSELYTVTVTKAPVQTGFSITEFRFNGLTPNVVGTINQTAHTIALSVPFTTNVTNLVATFTASPMATVKIGATVQESGVTVNDFTTPKTYRVTSESGVNQDYVVTVTKIPLSTANDITDFRFTNIGINPVIGVIDQAAKTITISLPFGTNRTTLRATFTNSPSSTVKIGSTVQVSNETINDFTNPVFYDVYAEDPTDPVRRYTVTATIYEMPKRFETYKFDTYTLIQGDTVKYVANGTINNTSRLVQVNIPASAQKNSLAATFTLTANTRALIGTVPQVSGTTLNDFTSARSYTLAADDGSVTDYTVTVTNNPIDTQKQLLTFSFNGLNPVVNGTVTEATKTVDVTVPFGTDRSALVASFSTTSTLTRVKVAGVRQKSGTTVNNFTAPVTYRLYDEAGDSTDYTVNVNVAAGSPAKDITYFAFLDFNPDVIGAINETSRTITATVPNGANRSSIKATFTASALSTVTVAGVVQESGVTLNDFRIPVVYTVTAQDGTTKNYTVGVAEAADTTKPVVTNALQTVNNKPGQFVLVRSNEATGKVYIIKENVEQTTIAHLEAAVTGGKGRSAYVTAANTDVALSTANLPDGRYFAYAIDAAQNKSARGTNAITVEDRLAPISKVDAQTKTNALGNVVYVQSSEANSIVYLLKEGELHQTKTQLDAAVTAKKGARALVLTANSDVPVVVAGLVAGNYHAFAVDIPYNNVSEPSTNVVVITEASRAKSILAFSFNQLDPPVIGQIIGTDISLTVKVGTPVTALVATFTISPLSKAYVGAIEQVSGVTPNNFTEPVTYRVTAEDGSFADYKVSVWFNTGVDTRELFSQIKSFPNPVADRLTIESGQPLDRIIVVNGLGQVVEDLRNPGLTEVGIPTDAWTKGIYFVRFYRDEQYIGVHKIIKE